MLAVECWMPWTRTLFWWENSAWYEETLLIGNLNFLEYITLHQECTDSLLWITGDFFTPEFDYEPCCFSCWGLGWTVTGNPSFMGNVKLSPYVGEKLSGTLNVKCCSNPATMIFICIIANSLPIQMRGPACTTYTQCFFFRILNQRFMWSF